MILLKLQPQQRQQPNGSDNDRVLKLTVTSTLNKEGDIIIVHGESFSLTVTDDGGTGDNHTLRQICRTMTT